MRTADDCRPKNSRGAHDGVIMHRRRKLQTGPDVISLQVGIVFKDFLPGSVMSQYSYRLYL